MEWLGKIHKFICKDTGQENESRKVVMTVRIEVLSVLLYCLCNFVTCLAFNIPGSSLLLGFALLFTGLFILSYKQGTQTIYVLFNLLMLAMPYFVVLYYGWNIGVQHFVLMLLLLCFFNGYGHNLLKVLYVLFLCAYRMLLFFRFRSSIPRYPVSKSEEIILQVISTLMVFWCISVVTFVFSKTSQELEGKLIEYNNRLKRQADTDALTGLCNRRRAVEYMEEMTSRGIDEKGFSLCICDIDFFKKVNDNYGHDVGDVVLRKVGEILKEEMKDKGLAARWGGEEFLLLFKKCNGDKAYIFLQDISSRIKNSAFHAENEEFHITVTFGLSEYDFVHGFDATIKEADEKLYLGKEKGRDRIIF